MKVILASAGTGKTHALLELFRNRVEAGLPPYRIALVTFSRRAAEELFARAQAGGAAGAAGPFVGTIHGFLRALHTLAAPWTGRGVPEFLEEFEAELVFLEEARSHLLEEGLPDERLEDLALLFRKRAYAWPLFPVDEEADRLLGLFKAVLGRYRGRMGPRLGPADLELAALDLLEDPGACRLVAARFPLVLVDEYQDTSPLQARVFQALERAGSEVVAVGDSKQSIYGFRNADVEAFRQAVREGQVLKRLEVSHRHPEALVAFLNALTAHLFREEHFPVKALRPGGRVEVHWVKGEGRLEELRSQEARFLAQRLWEARAEGFAFSQMAVLYRSRASLETLEPAFQEAGLPYVVVRGRGFFQRPEVRAVYRALSYAATREEEDLYALLLGPYFGLSPSEVKSFLEEPSPRLEALCDLAQLAPLEALKRVVRDEAFRGRLDRRARQNLDALLVQAGARAFRDLEGLLLWIRQGAGDPEAGEVPEAGEGVRLMTIHAAKGLQFPLVALFDLSRWEKVSTPRLWVDRDGGVAYPRSAGGKKSLESLLEEVKRKEAEEARRLLYVALSRAEEVLLVTGSYAGQRLSPWGEALRALGYGPEGPRAHLHDRVLTRGQAAPVESGKRALEVAPYTETVFAPPDLPLFRSPSRAKEGVSPEDDRGPLGEAEEVPGWGRAVGILTHWAIAEDLDPGEGVVSTLLSQEVALFFPEPQRRQLVEEVLELLRAYRALMAKGGLAPLEARDEDYAELPLVLQEGETTWVGVADRVYRVGGEWFLEDYKTDHEVRPEVYRLQLEVYQRALERAWGVRPRVRLVYLRRGEVVEE